MLESSGLYGRSNLRIVDISSGQVLQQVNVDGQYFAEGCTYFPYQNKYKVVQLTWKSGTGLVYDLDYDFQNGNTNVPALSLVGTFPIQTTNGEGWGIVYHPQLDQFIVSDGSSNLHFWKLRSSSDSDNDGDLEFDLVRTLPVTRRLSLESSWTSVWRLNELEWDPHSNTILANVWQQNHIVRIRLDDGKVTHQYDLSSLSRPSGADVLNGIAAVWDSRTTSSVDQFWVTGKLWSQMYRIQLVDN